MTKEDDITTGKSIAILAYITAIGFILAIVMNTDRKNSFIAYHIRQSLGLILLFIVVWLLLIFLNFIISIPVLNWLLYATGCCMPVFLYSGYLVCYLPYKEKKSPFHYWEKSSNYGLKGLSNLLNFLFTILNELLTDSKQ